MEHEDNERTAISLIDLLTDYAGTHPTRYRRVRAFLVRTNLFGHSERVREHAEQARGRLRDAFLNWLGPTARIAVDTETGQEYRWEDVVVFGEDMDGEDRRRLTSAIKNTLFLSESIFLLYGGKIVRLADIPPGGVWVRRLGERHGKAVYRITVHSRGQDTYELAANLNESLDPEDVRSEIDWLILCGHSDQRAPVVEDFGEYLSDHDLWSEEYIPGATLDRELRRLARRAEEGREDLALLWPFLAWSALSAYVDVWDRTGKRYEISDLSPHDIVLPTHDYQSGSPPAPWHAEHDPIVQGPLRRARRDRVPRSAGSRNLGRDLLGRVGSARRTGGAGGLPARPRDRFRGGRVAAHCSCPR